ncbi:SRPBCC family protein [Arthrobacter cupressi]
MHAAAPAGQGPVFVYATYIRTTPEQLWQALTDPAFTERYWGVALRSDWQQGSTITWEVAGVTIADPEQVVLAVEEPRRLEFTWHTITPEFGAAVGGAEDEVAAMAAEGRSRVRFEIEPLDGMVKLTVTHSGFDEGSTILAGVTDGWPGVLASLKTLLETGEPLVFS